MTIKCLLGWHCYHDAGRRPKKDRHGPFRAVLPGRPATEEESFERCCNCGRERETTRRPRFDPRWD